MTSPTLTWTQLEAMHPCSEAIEWGKRRYRTRRTIQATTVLRALIKARKLDWTNWLIVRVMSYHQYVSYAIFAAEQVLDFYEKQYPNDLRPRQAIEAAKNCLASPTPENKERAAKAAEAAVAAGWAAKAAEAARAAERAAGASWAAGWAAWAAEAARAAERAAGAAAEAAGRAAREEMQRKILTYGLDLLKGEKRP